MTYQSEFSEFENDKPTSDFEKKLNAISKKKGS